MIDLLQALQWRYATKKMKSTEKVPQDKVDYIAAAVRLTKVDPSVKTINQRV